MVAFRVTAIIAIFTSLMVCAAPAGAKVARTDSSAAAGDAQSAKPLQLTLRRARATARAQARAARAATARAAKADRSPQTARNRILRKHVTRKWAARARHAKIRAAQAVEQAEIDEPTETAKVPVTTKVPVRKPRDATAAPRRDRVADGEQTSGFAAMWAERSIGAPERPAASDGRIQQAQAESVVASEPAPVPAVAPRPARVASQEELNEMDLAAASMAGSSDSFWLRGLFIVFGGLIAAGSALRLFV